MEKSFRQEWDQINARTKCARAAAAKAQGVKLGIVCKNNLKANIEERTNAANTFAAKLTGTNSGIQRASCLSGK